MPRLPAGFEARSRDLASTADPISILPDPLTAAAMIVARYMQALLPVVALLFPIA
jgi:hypothetical protein